MLEVWKESEHSRRRRTEKLMKEECCVFRMGLTKEFRGVNLEPYLINRYPVEGCFYTKALGQLHDGSYKLLSLNKLPVVVIEVPAVHGSLGDTILVQKQDRRPIYSLCACMYAAARTKNWSRLAIYADRSVVVLNKPPYLVCQGSDAQDGEAQKPRERNVDKFNDLLSDLKDHFRLDKVPHTVHRLDKSTTGALVLAKNLTAARQLSQQFQNRSIGKTYLALVRGGEKSFQARSGEIRDPLETDGGHVSISQSCKAKFAATDWELVASSPKAPLSLLKLTLHTGLKHQLRVHLAHSLHTPILGDPVYSRSPISEQIARTIRVPENRLFLHASRLCFSRFRKTGPNKHLRLEVAAALPSDFVTLCRDAGIPLDPWDITGGLFVDGEPAGHEIPDLDGKWLKSSYRMIC